MYPTQKYLPNLNTLRFLSSSAVLFAHVDHALVNNKYKDSLNNFFPFNFGTQAVNLFFVLSGFLITHLLLNEKQNGNINVKNFYLKRILRIWPLYYLIILLSVFFLNSSPFFFWNNITNSVLLSNHPLIFAILLGLILPNIALLGTTTLGYATPTWSIGVEEQFYLIWPWIIKRKSPLIIIICIIIVVYILSIGTLLSGLLIMKENKILSNESYAFIVLNKINKFFTFNYSFKIDSMAIGALAAFLANKDSFLLKKVFSKSFQYLTYLIAFYLLTFPNSIGYQIYSMVFALVILNLSLNEKSVFSIENKSFKYLGNISYGIYIYHTITIIPIIKLVAYFSLTRLNLWNEIVICIFCLIVTIGLASFSYHFYEGYFRSLRSRFQKS